MGVMNVVLIILFILILIIWMPIIFAVSFLVGSSPGSSAWIPLSISVGFGVLPAVGVGYLAFSGNDSSDS